MRSRLNKPLKDILAEEATAFQAEADKLPPGRARDLLLKRIRQAEIASRADDWAQSPGLKPPEGA